LEPSGLCFVLRRRESGIICFYGVVKMAVINVLLLVFFVIVSILLILLVLLQNEDGDSLGGIFAGGSGSAFGSRSGNILTRTTTILGALFLVISLSLALLNRTPSSTVEQTAREADSANQTEWWSEETAEQPNLETPAAE
jgi:preprotein translocase subunit SecG